MRKVLIANRGEIAVRLIRACRELGLAAVALYSEADVNAPWVRLADQAYALPGESAAESYLNQERVLAIAREAGADALHPGYGFLSENAEFAAACEAAGVTFVGPSADSMRKMGSKASAREIARRVGVPVTPGVDGAGKTEAQLQESADTIGYPLLIKASAGGGGKGMRVVEKSADLPDALRAARAEARSAFGDDHLILERYFTHIHHVEIQILGDRHGNIRHLFERECSVQRRHQKVIEESPAPCLTPALRAQMTEAALALAREVQYTSAGTLEFMVVPDGQFYFLEMNTRLQVEHPVTELVTGIDLAAWQLRIAAGEAIPFAQADLRQRGHAIECRLYAEDPANGFLPSIGTLTCYQPAHGPGVRVDDGIETGSRITPWYDPMLAKLITWGADREEAIRKMDRALRDTVVLGVTNNLAWLRAILAHPRFVRGDTPTSFLAQELPHWRPPLPEGEMLALLGVLELLRGNGGAENRPNTAHPDTPLSDPWAAFPDWRNVRS
jgi:acetyl-CoA carboxylase biotin carboxylase subunit